MALLFCDGFGHVEDGYDTVKWDGGDITDMFYEAGAGRDGGWGFYLYDTNTSATAEIIKYFSTSIATFIFGAALKGTSSFSDTTDIIKFTDGASTQLTVRVSTAGEVSVLRNGTVLATTVPAVMSLGVWAYIEVKATIHSSAGAVEVRVDGTTVINISGVNTQATGNASVNGLWLQCYWVREMYIDDLYFCDTSGTKNNDFLGDITIQTIYPTSDGNSSDFTPSDGTDHFAMVDDPQLANETTYNSSVDVGDKELYGMTTYAGPTEILAVQVTAAVKNADQGTMYVRPLCRSGAVPVDNEGPDLSLSQTMRGAMAIFEEEPTDAVDWTTAKINAAEFGLKIES